MARTIRLFVSSTFEDFKAERNALQGVFGKLRLLCEQHGCRFEAVDLRWGVSVEAGLDQQTIPICLEEVARCREVSPRLNLLILLGNRYGWRPLPHQISAPEFERLRDLIPGEERPADGISLSVRELLDLHYRNDQNAVPAVYCLQPRQVSVPEDAGELERNAAEDAEARQWRRDETVMRQALAAAASQLYPDERDPRRRPYEASAVQLEVSEGLPELQPAEHAFCYRREIAGLPRDARAGAYRDLSNGVPDEDAERRLSVLIGELEKRLPPSRLWSYQVTWPEVSEPPVLHALCARAEQDLQSAILEELALLDQLSDVEQEIAAHREFAQARAMDFTGRDKTLTDLLSYVSGQDTRPMIVSGPAGSGKTALLAQAALITLQGEARLLYRSVGATPGSSEIYTLLDSLCSEMADAAAEVRSAAPDFATLAVEFQQRLLAGLPDRRMVLILDGVDQIRPSDGCHSLTWLPCELHARVKLIVSVAEGSESLAAAQSLLPLSCLRNLSPMAVEEGEALLDCWLERARRQLTQEQRDAVLARFAGNGLPLYLRLMFVEARRWHSYDLPTAFAPDVEGIVGDLFARLGDRRHHGPALVYHSIGYLAAARNGLAEEEMLDLLARDKPVMDEFRRRNRRSPDVANLSALPPLIWVRLRTELAPYLTERRADGTQLLTFFHRQVRQAAERWCLEGGEGKQRAGHLAEYFALQPHRFVIGGRDNPNLRKLAELPYQQAQAEHWKELQATLGDPSFLEAKCGAGGIYDLLADCDRALRLAPATPELPVVTQVRRVLSLAQPAIVSRPDLALQVLYNRLAWLPDLTPALRTALDAARQQLDSQGPWLRAAAPLSAECGTPDAFPAPTTIRYPFQTAVQSFAPGARMVAVAAPGGEVEIYDLGTGVRRGELRIAACRLAGIALREDARALAFLEQDGRLGSTLGHLSLAGRPGEHLLAFHSAVGVVAVRSDSALVTWDPISGSTKTIAEGLPAPLVALRLSLDASNLLYVAGERRQKIGCAVWTAGHWQTWEVPYDGPRVLDADLEPSGRSALFAAEDRMLRVIHLESGREEASLAYTRRPESGLTGKPDNCASGFAETAGCAFFATRGGHVGCWNRQTDTLERLEDYREFSVPARCWLFQAVPPAGQLFVALASEARMVESRKASVSSSIHRTLVSACVLTTDDQVVSASGAEGLVRWWTAEGLRPLGSHIRKEPTALAVSSDPTRVLVGYRQGWIAHQPLAGEPASWEVHAGIQQPVVSLFEIAERWVMVAGRSGLIVRLRLGAPGLDVVRYSTGMEERQQKVVPAGHHGLFWSLRRESVREGIHTIVSLCREPGREEVVFQSAEPWDDMAVTPDGGTLCLCGQSVVVLGRIGPGWKPVLRRDDPARRVAFLGNGDLLAVPRYGVPWLEIWQVAKGLPTLAALHLDSEVVSLDAANDRIVAGLLSGGLVSAQLHSQG